MREIPSYTSALSDMWEKKSNYCSPFYHSLNIKLSKLHCLLLFLLLLQNIWRANQEKMTCFWLTAQWDAGHHGGESMKQKQELDGYMAPTFRSGEQIGSGAWYNLKAHWREVIPTARLHLLKAPWPFQPAAAGGQAFKHASQQGHFTFRPSVWMSPEVIAAPWSCHSVSIG